MGEAHKSMLKALLGWIKVKVHNLIHNWYFGLILGITIGFTSTFCYVNGKALYQELFTYNKVYIAVASSATRPEDVVVKAQPEAMTQTDGSGVTAVIQRIAKKHDIDWKLVKAICEVESHCNSDRIGDNGGSYGAYQVSLPHHPDITKEQAQDFEWATEWTIKHCEKYKDNKDLFFACHNGIGKYPRNQWYVDRANEIYNKI